MVVLPRCCTYLHHVCTLGMNLGVFLHMDSFIVSLLKAAVFCLMLTKKILVVRVSNYSSWIRYGPIKLMARG